MAFPSFLLNIARWPGQGQAMSFDDPYEILSMNVAQLTSPTGANW